MQGPRKENRRSLLQRLKKVVATGRYTLSDIARDCAIPHAELEAFLSGKGYLFQREIDKLRACLPSFEDPKP